MTDCRVCVCVCFPRRNCVRLNSLANVNLSMAAIFSYSHGNNCSAPPTTDVCLPTVKIEEHSCCIKHASIHHHLNGEILEINNATKSVKSSHCQPTASSLQKANRTVTSEALDTQNNFSQICADSEARTEPQL